MPGLVLPTFTVADVKSHDNAESCYITIGRKVYDVTEFVQDHPGGGDLVLEYAGKDVNDILKDTASHKHSEAAYDILEDYQVGFLDTTGGASKVTASADISTESEPLFASTGMSREEDLTIDTDYTQDFKQHKFLDLNRPLLPQLWFGGFKKRFYLDQIHRPRHYKGGASAPLFGNFLEPLSKTAWWVIPIVWVPPVIYGTIAGTAGLGNPIAAAAYWLVGFGLWSLIEYLMHRFLFHLDDYLPDNRVGLCLHFLLHGIHHYLPMDRYRLVMPPTLFVVLAAPFWKLAHAVFFYNYFAALQVYCGGIFGYICYDLTHYFLHHRNLPVYYQALKKHHLQHHYADYDNGFGVTTKFWDGVFGTALHIDESKPKAE
ncbi:fatty acid hydroxylase [Penicillium taxi]|uniref:fatty acid hydroxylase n=1 Tax=Penicillium taxi TaxID=168475 RepID=UPI002545940F|nr:fatty acid hydroxylase [Penicillium taxi]KAJ5901684.1 fatty acid hydroxylase [Penicillium taxi]